MISIRQHSLRRVSSLVQCNKIDLLFNSYPSGSFKSEQEKFTIIRDVMNQTGLRINHKMLNEIDTIDQLKREIIKLSKVNVITPGNPLEELFEMKKPPSNLRIVQYRRKCDGGPIVIVP